MVEKIGIIKNPLTVIAIFAGIAEVSGTVVLPFIGDSNQSTFIWFLIIFPSLLVVAFFVTLNFNNRVLYAPSDYQDETNYIRTMRYDLSKDENILVDTPAQSSVLSIESIESIIDSKISILASAGQIRDQDILDLLSTKGGIQDQAEFLVSNLPGVKDFIFEMNTKGYSFKIWNTSHIPVSKQDARDPEDGKVILVGPEVDFGQIKECIALALVFFPFLQYVLIYGDFNQVPRSNTIMKTMFIGGSTENVVKKRLKKITREDFNQLLRFEDKESFFSYVRAFYPPLSQPSN